MGMVTLSYSMFYVLFEFSMSLCYFYKPLNTNLCPSALYPQPEALKSSKSATMKGHPR